MRLDDQPVVIPSRPAQSLLAYLVLSAGTPHRREKIAALLWPDSDQDNARGYLRNALWHLRRAIEAGLPAGVQYILADELTLAFNPMAPAWLDAAVLERPIAPSQRHARSRH